jgi:hypothetical protein
MIRRPRVKDPKHLNWIRTLDCAICDDNTSTEAAHIRYADSAYLKRAVGKGEKPNDEWVIPLCGRHHRAQHAAGDERMWWFTHCLHPVHMASLLHKHSGDTELVPLIIKAARMKW